MEHGGVKLEVKLSGPSDLMGRTRQFEELREQLAKALDQFTAEQTAPVPSGGFGSPKSPEIIGESNSAQRRQGPVPTYHAAPNVNLDSDRMPDLSAARPHIFPGGFNSSSTDRTVSGNLIGPQAFPQPGSPIRGGGLQPPPGGPDGLDGQIPLPPGARGSRIQPNPRPDDFQGGPVHPYYM